MARLNFSFADLATHIKVTDNIKKALSTRPEKTVGIIMDTRGAEVRCGMFDQGNKEVELVKDAIVKITTDIDGVKGNAQEFACSYKGICKAVKVGGSIMFYDGEQELEVTEIGEVRNHFCSSHI